ncbi:Laccase-2 [Psilocybe cubensis]|uniref:Laccase-2 n=2 Tax=Psilocybe cubensis TaxID=181762 RepID=A0ACB8GUL0_PSICU|nr:Laccase-2 [Psilocybe cubensis]KAH9479132.1 Laccase-2 [Psilocybe cubensis]
MKQLRAIFIDAATGAFSSVLGPSSDLYIGNKKISPDGYWRSAALAGACEDPERAPGDSEPCKKVSLEFPGPLIKGKKGDSFDINVINQLNDDRMLRNTSIHWHGFFQRNSSWADGPVGVTQCPIPPDYSFRYQFKVPDQAGTFWYHSHHSTQYCDGLRGPMVIYDPEDPHEHLYDVDDDSTIITLADWYHVYAKDVPRGIPPAPGSNLINGLGRQENGTETPLAVINVKQGKRYRFRLISMSCDPFYDFSIGGHNMTIIEADGENVKPVTVQALRIFAGQRYSFVLHANQIKDNYWIHSIPSAGYAGTTNFANSAILRYVGAPETYPRTKNVVPVLPLLDEMQLHPLHNIPAPGIPIPGHADVNLPLFVSLDTVAEEWLINNITYETPSLPTLLQLTSKAYRPQQILKPGGYIELPPNKVIELVLTGEAIGSPHPFHLHGHTFHVVRSAGSDVYNFRNPVIRDVVSMGTGSPNDKVTIRFVTDNAGPWFLHCHIDWHLEMGLSLVFAEDIKGIEQSFVPPTLDKMCKLDKYLGSHRHY